MNLAVKEVNVKSIIVKSGLPDTDYVVNPYIGCQFGCSYCYASFMGRFSGFARDEWGGYLLAKTNAPELFRKEICKRAFCVSAAPSVLFSSVTDPYQPAERQYELTRSMLQIVADIQYPGEISILTKSNLVCRDIDILCDIPNAQIGITVNTTDSEVKSTFERLAPGYRVRLNALEALNGQGLSTYAFVGPVFPHCLSNLESIEDVLREIRNAGTHKVYVEHLNLNPGIKSRLEDMIGQKVSKPRHEGIVQFDDAVAEMCVALGLEILLDKPIVHNPKSTLDVGTCLTEGVLV
jgi:DNA repair photolyase